MMPSHICDLYRLQYRNKILIWLQFNTLYSLATGIVQDNKVFEPKMCLPAKQNPMPSCLLFVAGLFVPDFDRLSLFLLGEE